MSRLSEVEASRVSGVLKFKGAEGEGEVRLVGGQIAAEQPDRDDGQDPVEMLLELREGAFEVLQQLPPLPISRGDLVSRSGSLDVHVAADLMNYCEHAGLTGLLTLESEQKRAEIVYDKGELGSIKLDGAEELNEVFGWEEGSFKIEAQSPEEVEAELTPEEVPVVKSERPDSTSKHFLKVVEVTLSEILREREVRRPGSRTGPPIPKMEAHKHETLPPPKKKEPRGDQTVRVIYLGASVSKRAEGGKTRHVSGSKKAEEGLPEALPERRSEPEPKSDSRSMKADKTKKSGSKSEPGRAVSTKDDDPTKRIPGVGWAVLTLVLAVFALWLLSMLPPIE